MIGFGNGNGQGMSLDLKIIWVHVPRLPVPHLDRDRCEHFILGPTSPIGRLCNPIFLLKVGELFV